MKIWFTGTHGRLHLSLAHLHALCTQANCIAVASCFTGEYRTHPCVLRLSHARATRIIVSTPQRAHTNHERLLRVSAYLLFVFSQTTSPFLSSSAVARSPTPRTKHRFRGHNEKVAALPPWRGRQRCQRPAAPELESAQGMHG